MKKITFSLIALLAVAAMQAQIIHVPADYPTIQSGINVATPGDTVLVSDGQYYEQINFAGKKPLMVASLYLIDGDKNHIANTIIDGSQIANSDSASVVYFISGEDSTSVINGFTICHGCGTKYLMNLDAELSRNGSGTGASIRNGFSDRKVEYVDLAGGGIFISGSGAKIINNHITENHLTDTLVIGVQIIDGAGIATRMTETDEWIVISHNVIDHNSIYATQIEGFGAGMSLCYNSRIVGNTISNNLNTGTAADVAAGGIGIYQNKNWITKTAFVEQNLIQNNLCKSSGNYANSAGGFISVVNGHFTGNSLINNVVSSGTSIGGVAGVLLWDPADGFHVKHNLFKDNMSNRFSGGLGMQTSSQSTNIVWVENNYFKNNTARDGGAIAGWMPFISHNNVFSGNNATTQGGAIYLYDEHNAPMVHPFVLINNSFYGNSAITGGAIINHFADMLILNSIFWNDSAPNGNEIFSLSGTSEIAYTDIDTSNIFPSFINGGGLINENPLFGNNETLKTSHFSPCVDAGTNVFTCSHGITCNAPDYDINGFRRPQGAGYDMGAFDMGKSQVIRIPADYPTIRQGIVAANPGDTVLVSDGIYYEQINFLGKKPLMVASGYLMDGDTNHIANTIIDGSRLTNPDSASVAYFISGEDTSSVLLGFTIQNGKGTSWFWEGYESLGGGGIYVARSTAKISHNIITNNTLDDTAMPDFSGGCGGGIHVSYGFPGTVVIEENKIFSNTVITNHLWTEGGGIYVFGAHSIIRNNLVTNNSSTNTNDTTEWAHGSAAGIICEGDTASVLAIATGNLIQDNIATGGWIGYGGGMALWSLAEGSFIKDNHLINNSNNWYGGGIDLAWNEPNVRIDGNYFFGNSAAYGGAVDSWDYGSNHCLVNNVFRGNNATEEGGAIWLRLEEGNTGYYASMINNTFSGNHAGSKGGAIYSWDYNPVIVNSVFWDNSAPEGNVIAIDTGNAEIAYSDIDTLKISGEKIFGGGNINADPLFSDISLLTTEHWSPVVDKGVEKYVCALGQTVFCPEKDILGIPRPVGSGYDMGAYDIKGWGQGFVKITNDELRMMNYPNPFRGSTTFEYTLTEPVHVRLQVFNSLGHLVAEPVHNIQQNGKQTVIWNSGDLPAGMYFYFIQAGNAERGGKCVKQ